MGLFNTIRMGSSAAGDYEVERSLRFNRPDTTHLTRTLGSTSNRRTFTYSFWIKRTVQNDEQNVIYNGAPSSTPYGEIRFEYQGSNIHELNFYSYDGSQQFQLRTNRKFRDPNAWYHIVCAADTTQGTESNRIKIYVNGVQETDFKTETYPSQNIDTGYNISGNAHNIGALRGSSNPLNGYLAEINYVDGQQLAASDFGKTDAVTGQWVPKKYTGSYGTHGFYLNFSDNSGTSATTLGKDYSGNSNNFTPNNFVTGDAVKDTPTNNFSTMRHYATPPSSGAALSEGNLRFVTGTSGSGRNNNRTFLSTFMMTSGKWYAEVKLINSELQLMYGVSPYQVRISPSSNNSRYAGIYGVDGNLYIRTGGSESIVSHGAALSQGDVLCIYIDMDASTPEVYFGKNGQWANGSGSWNQSTPTSAVTLGDSFFTTDTGGFEGIAVWLSSGGASFNPSGQANFGQDSTFSGSNTAGTNTDANGIGSFKYAVPTGALAMCSANLPDPSITFPNKHFGTLTYGGNDSTQTISDTNAVDFTPDFTWVKRRDGSNSHILTNSVTGVTNYLISSRDNAEGTNAAFLTAFVNGGFTSGNNGDMNGSGRTYVAWNWKGADSTATNTDGTNDSYVRANTTAGFSIVKYVGHSSASVVGHGLGVAPEIIFVKQRNGTNDWRVWVDGFTDTDGKYFSLQATIGLTSGSDKWNGSPTSTVFGVANDDSTGGSSKEFIAYCFNSVAGYSKIGSYKGNQDADGTFVYTGFRPAWVVVKGDWGGNWNLFDNKRPGYNVTNDRLFPNLNDAETDGSPTGNQMDFLSNGFKLTGSNVDTNHSATFIYLAFAEAPFKYSRAR